MTNEVSGSTSTPPASASASGDGAPTGAASDAAFNEALAKMTAAAEKRLEQDALRTEVQEIIGAAKQAAARTSA